MSLAYLLIFTIPSIKPQIETENKPKQAWMIALVAVAVSAGVYYAEGQKAAQKKSEKEAKKLQAQQMAEQQQIQLQAGEYWEDISEKQMMLQASENKFKTLADLMLLKMKKRKESPEIYTTPVQPAAKQPASIIDQINQSIDKFLRG